jgi:hypothetical protein
VTEALLALAVKAAVALADKLTSKKRPELDPRINQLESERLLKELMDTARARMEAEKARKRAEREGKS